MILSIKITSNKFTNKVKYVDTGKMIRVNNWKEVYERIINN